MLPDLRPYQLETISQLVRWGRGLNALEPGLGKCVTTLRAVDQVLPVGASVLVLCGVRSAIRVWRDEITKWLPEANVVLYEGTPSARDRRWQDFEAQTETSTRTFLISTVHMAVEVAGRSRAWPAIIIDEAHVLRNRPMRMFAAICRLRSAHVYCLTGTPVVRDFRDLWPLLRLIDPKRFSSFWRFAHTYGVWMPGPFGSEMVAARDLDQLKQELRQYMFRRTRAQVALQTPPKLRQRLPYAMTERQADLYRQTRERLVAETSSGLLISPTAIARDVRLRQISLSPRLVGDAECGGALAVLRDHLANEIATGTHRAVIFSPFVAALQLLRTELADLGAKIYLITGGMTSRSVSHTVADFQNDRAAVALLLASVQVALSWEATVAPLAYFFGFDWNPATNWQAEDRLCRPSSVYPQVRIYYLTGDDTYDAHVLEVLDSKTAWVQRLEPSVGESEN